MPIINRKEFVWNGHRGIVTTRFSVIMRNSPFWAQRGIPIDADPSNTFGTVGHSLQLGEEGETWHNRITGETEFLPYEMVIAAYPNINLNDAFLRVEAEFVPAEGEVIYPSDMASEMLQRGWDSSEIEDLQNWERQIRNNPNHR